MENNIESISGNWTHIHADNSTKWRHFFLALIFLFISAMAFFFFLFDVISGLFFLIIHIAISMVAALNCYDCWRKKEDLRQPLLLWGALMGGGMLGGLGFLIFWFSYPIFTYFSTSMATWLEELFPEQRSTNADIYYRISAGWDDYSKIWEIVPFQDTFTYGTLEQKQGVLDAIAKDFHPDYASLLQQALENESNVIRIQAAAIITKIDHDFDMKVRKIYREGEFDSDTLGIELKLAQYFEFLAYSALLDEERCKEVQAKAAEHYKNYLKQYPRDEKSQLALGRLYLRMGAFEELIVWFEKYKKEYGEVNVKGYSWYLEALYLLKKYDLLVESAKDLLKRFDRNLLPNEVQECIETWAHSS